LNQIVQRCPARRNALGKGAAFRAFELYDDPAVLALLAHAEASIGKQTEARQILAQLTEEAKERYAPALRRFSSAKKFVGFTLLALTKRSFTPAILPGCA
jgi:hypothetical protein